MYKYIILKILKNDFQNNGNHFLIKTKFFIVFQFSFFYIQYPLNKT
jgi:hypothetical protein